MVTVFFASTFASTNVIQFIIQGIINPTYAQSTNTFVLRSYTKSGSVYTFSEPSYDNFTITPDSGTLS